MTGLADLRPGDIGFGPLNSRGAKLLVDAGQLMLGEGFRVGRLNIEHVFVVTEAVGQSGSSSMIGVVEAMPSGAREIITGARFTPEYAYVRLPEDYSGQGEYAAAIARAMIGTPYSFASYAALAAWKFGLKTPKLERWIDRRDKPMPWAELPKGANLRILENWAEQGKSDTMKLPAEAICSVLADQAWSLTGKKIMQGVAHQCVTPGALAWTLLRMEGTQWIWPGSDN